MPRLIDAEALARKWQYVLDVNAEEKDTVAYATFELFIERLKEEPTIDPESLRPHGRWIWDEEDECWICSNCENTALNNWRWRSTDSEYCPTCGAKMDLEE